MSKFVGKKLVILGVTYKSMGEAARAAGLTYPTFTGRLTQGWSLTRAFKTPPARGKSVTFKGVTYPSRKAAALAVGLHERLLDSRLHAGWTLERALATPTNSVRLFTYEGKTYPSVAACARALGLSRALVWSRMKRGHSAEVALATRKYARVSVTHKTLPKLPWTQRVAWLEASTQKVDGCWVLRGHRVMQVRIWGLAGLGWHTAVTGCKGLFKCPHLCVNPAHARFPVDTRPVRGVPVGKEDACRGHLEKALMETPSGHWSWTGRHTRELPMTRLPGMGEMSVPVAMWLAYRGPLPRWSHVRAICDKDWCVNPDHLGRVIRSVP